MVFKGFTIKNIRSVCHDFDGQPTGPLVCNATNGQGDVVLFSAKWCKTEEQSVPGIILEFKNAVQVWHNDNHGENNATMPVWRVG